VLVQLLVIAAGLWYVFHDPQKRAQIVEALRDGGLCWVIIGYHPSAWGLVGAAVFLTSQKSLRVPKSGSRHTPSGDAIHFGGGCRSVYGLIFQWKKSDKQLGQFLRDISRGKVAANKFAKPPTAVLCTWLRSFKWRSTEKPAGLWKIYRGGNLSPHEPEI
jgi:hypothetical protein